MNEFRYKDGALCAEDVPLSLLATELGTPLYVYSYTALAENYRAFDSALAAASQKRLVCYAMKACPTLGVLSALVQLGAGVDTVSAGEIQRARAAGVAPDKIVFSGVGKRADEIAYALEGGLRCFNVESEPELELIAEVAARMKLRAPISVRVNPDVDAATHPYISTGLKANKFGVPVGRARALYRRAQALHSVRIVGLDCHIGSQLTQTRPFTDAIERLIELVEQLREDGIGLESLDLGGGLGIGYEPGASIPSPADYGAAIGKALAPLVALDLTIICEPGRVLVGSAGILLCRTLYVKDGEDKTFVIVDAGMNDLMRPALYDAHHEIIPVEQREQRPFVADVVGPVCETGDFFAHDRTLSQVPLAGDLMAVMSAGAYGFSMSSTYNSRPRAAEVMVRDTRWDVIRDRETMLDLTRGERRPSFI
ncbi:MAG: diaminopimelate decarboxylase [Polyangia bacterium]